ncbi:WD40 repeat-like protein [Pisolithus marmoratus]|nr:WD40 repeat-like protein [Pisolithus marmoratus]
MSTLKNSPFGKCLRASETDDDEALRRIEPRTSRLNTPSLALWPTMVTPLTMRSDSTRPDSLLDSCLTTYGDRFMPTHDMGNMRTSYHLLDNSGPCMPLKHIILSEPDMLKEQANLIFTSILHTEVTPPSHPPTAPASSIPPSMPTRHCIFHYTSPFSGPLAPAHHLDTPMDKAYSMSPIHASSCQLLESPCHQPHAVCKTPYYFYLNLIDWSTTNILGISLSTHVYLWTAFNATVAKLCDLSNVGDNVSSIAWVQKVLVPAAPGTILAHISALSWNTDVLSSWSCDRMVHHHDVHEVSTHPFHRYASHKHEVCGLRWSTGSGNMAGSSIGTGAMLTSSGNDNKVCIWDLRGSRCSSATAVIGVSPGMMHTRSGSLSAFADGGDLPLWKFHDHTAAVKALAWDPHVSGVLASGGGMQDKHIQFWNTHNGSILNQLDTGSQVCNLIWSLTSHKLVSMHGFSSTTVENQICIWQYPSLSMVAMLTGHTHRVLYLTMSPEGETIVMGAGNEMLRFWNAFPQKENGEWKETMAHVSTQHSTLSLSLKVFTSFSYRVTTSIWPTVPWLITTPLD